MHIFWFDEFELSGHALMSLSSPTPRTSEETRG
jgi:hypothetical protein